MSKIAFIGTGNMGGALVIGVCKAIEPRQVAIYDRNGYKMRALKEKTGCTVCGSIDEAAENAEYLVLGVKPQVFADLQKSLVPAMKKAREKGIKQTVISIRAGLTLDTLAEIPMAAGLDLSIVRMLPNTPCEVGDGLILRACNGRVTDRAKEEILSIFAECGLFDYVTEHIIDVASAVSGCSPAFAYMFIEALSDGAVRCGVPRDKAIKYAAQAVMGSAQMVLQTGRHPDALKDAVCSPGGSTIVGVATLENSAFRARSANAVYYANERNKELGKK